MLPLGTPLPPFSLPTVEGGTWSTQQLDRRPLLVLFICAHCPYVKHVEASLSAMAQDFSAELQMLAISKQRDHPSADAPEHLLAQKLRCGWDFPYLHDVDQQVARLFPGPPAVPICSMAISA